MSSQEQHVFCYSPESLAINAMEHLRLAQIHAAAANAAVQEAESQLFATEVSPSPSPSPSPCQMCGAKRPSPSSIPQFGISSNNCDAAEIEPKNKKPMLHADFQFCGCKEIKLPIDFSALMTQQPQQAPPSESDLAAATKSKASPELRRCVSDPFAAPGDDNNNENGVGDSNGVGYDGLFRRCVSDLYQSPGTVAKNGDGVEVGGTIRSPARPPLYPGRNRVTPPKAPVADSIIGASPDTLRLKRIRNKWKEMSRWWDNVTSEEDDNPDETNHSAEAQDTGVKEQEEEVHVEKVGDGMKINLRCPCGSGFQILISGQSCYYKLM